MSYNFNEIEAKWQKYWRDNKTFHAQNPPLSGELEGAPKYYVLDMFPYPSGAGLHVGHPLGYIASDIYARYKRHKGFNVLHPQGYDSFGLPAEQYAIQTGQHPAVTTETNIKTYRRQLDQIGFSFDWSREFRTSDPSYYKWTQWIFIQLFNSWYNKNTDKAESVETLIAEFEKNGNAEVNASADDDIEPFTAEQWKAFSEKEQQEILLKYRLTFLSETEVNWCPALGTVLANDEIVNGVSERGGHPVVRKKMMQWSMRISAYAQRLLDGLQNIDWPQPLKDIQTNWIGRSEGAMVSFPILSFPKGEEKSEAGYMTGGNSSHLLLERAKEMRANPTQAEAVLWQQLKGKQLDNKFRQQHLIDDFIVDFVCLSKKIIIEVDGEYHNDKEQIEKDNARTEILEGLGYKILRFKNEEVLADIDGVVEKIKEVLDKTPLSSGKGSGDRIEVFTTRPDTIFGVSFMTLAPEHELVSKITTPEQKEVVEAYVDATAKRSERERMADVKTISGVFTGAYALHPFTGKKVPIWIGDYVLASYGTGAVMAVPCGDERDYAFAKHFGIDIPNIFEDVDISSAAFADKEKTIIANSDFLNGMNYKKATKRAIYELEQIGHGKGKINYRLRDAVFSRQRYWGEPFPVYYKDGMPQMIDAEHLPIVLPEVEKYLPTEDGRPPLGNAEVWAWSTKTNEVVNNDLIDNETIFPLELNTMPGWAGSSQYFNRYMDSHNSGAIFSKEAINYWQDVDLYIGGSEHATGHLLYSRFWQKFMFDRGYLPKDEFAKKLINQGMITGTSAFVYRITPVISKKFNNNAGMQTILSDDSFFVSKGLENDFLLTNLVSFSKENKFPKVVSEKISLVIQNHDLGDGFENDYSSNDYISFTIDAIHADVSFVNTSDELDIEAFKEWRPEFKVSEFILENGKYIVGREVEKMSKSKYNVVNPDNICKQYGADSLRLYEMFLGPLEQSKPWNTAGITGVHGFLKKLWKLYHDGDTFHISDTEPTKDNLKTLHKTIKKVEEDIENFSFNTSVSTFMIAVNELTAQKCTSKAILEPLLVLISPYAPHIAEQLYANIQFGRHINVEDLPNSYKGIAFAEFPKFEASHLVESSKNYPISFNGKMRFTLELPLDMSKDEIEKTVLAHEKTQDQLQGRTPKKVIVVPGKIVNIVG